MKRFLSALLAGVLCVGVLTGCGSTQDNTPVVMTVDGEDVQSSELAAYIVYNMMYYENYYGMDMSYMADESIFDGIKDGCKEQIVQYRAINKLAEQEGISLSKESEETLEENKKANRETMGSKTSAFARWIKYTVKGDTDPFVEYLNSYGYTEELYDQNCETMQLEQDIIDKYYDDGSILQEYNDTYLHAKSILISDQDADGNLMTGDELTAAQQNAQSILDKIKAGEDFDTLWEENNSDTAQSDNGYYFTEGDMVDEYYQGAKNIEVGSVGDELVYYEGYGWFIIERLELDEAALTDPTCYLNNTGDEDDDSTIKDAIGESMISEKLDEIIEEMDVETNDEYDKITAYNVNTYLPFAVDAFVSGSGSSGSAETSADTEVVVETGEGSGSAA